MYNYYLTRKNIISIKISTFTVSYIIMIATRESGGRDIMKFTSSSG